MPSRENSERVSHVLGNYEIFEELGRGGMGIVYRALDLSLDRPAAVKVLRDELRAQSMVVNRFAREARAAAALDHPNIVQMYTVGDAGDVPYIAMEYVDAESLSALMIREGTLPWRRALAIAEQVASALACAHDAQIIHRDVKPPNILMAPDDKAYVTDFGIAKILSIHDQLTVDGTKLGTPQYMSPERCKTGDASASSDLYSLGVLLFQMISGRLPHEGASATELVRRILSQPPARLRKYVPDIPEDVERLVAWLIERKPEHRPASAVEAREALARVRAGQPLEIETSAATRAILEFRDESKASKHRRSSKRRSRKERRTSSVKRYAIVASAAVGALVAGWIMGATMRSDTATAEVVNRDVSSWHVSRDVMSFLRESDSIWIAHFLAPTLRIQDMHWEASRQAFLVRVESGSSGDAPVQLAVDPVAQTARVVASTVPSNGVGGVRGVFLAPDTRGEPQLWAEDGLDSDGNRQLTFLEGGVAGPIAISDDGTWIAAVPVEGSGGALLLLYQAASR